MALELWDYMGLYRMLNGESASALCVYIYNTKCLWVVLGCLNTSRIAIGYMVGTSLVNDISWFINPINYSYKYHES